VATKLESLNCFGELHQKVVAGVAVENIADWVQEEKQEYLEIKRDSLVRVIYRYKSQLPPAEMVSIEPAHMYKRIEKLRRGINEVEELEKLYLLQVTRISLGTKVEETINFLNTKLTGEVALAQSLLQSMLKAKMELGILAKMPTQVAATLDVVERNTLDSLPEDQRQRLASGAGLLLKLLAEPGTQEQILESIPDAEYTIEPVPLPEEVSA